MNFFSKLSNFIKSNIYFARSLHNLPCDSIVFFPVTTTCFSCGLTGIVAFKKAKKTQVNDCSQKIDKLESTIEKIEENSYSKCNTLDWSLEEYYLGGKSLLQGLWDNAKSLKHHRIFFHILFKPDIQIKLNTISDNLEKIINQEESLFANDIGRLSGGDVKILGLRIEMLKDIAWCLKKEILYNLKKTDYLLNEKSVTESTAQIYQRINAVLNSIDRLEVRGRDSAGISIIFILEPKVYNDYTEIVEKNGLSKEFNERVNKEILVNKSISLLSSEGRNTSLVFTYKIAAEIGSLGDNIAFIRNHIREDELLYYTCTMPNVNHTVSAHTRWASVGAITESNCHPQDNKLDNNKGIIHVCLNGDIDNYLELKALLENDSCTIHPDITTDTKIIPLQIDKYYRSGHDITEAIRLAVNDFEGSHAIAIQTDLAPGKIYLAQKGSGQTIFIGISDEHYMPTSEVYGFIEETSKFIKMDGEKKLEAESGTVHGQLFELNQDSQGGLDGIRAFYYDGTKILLNESDVKQTEITSRDIDRQGFPHYFLKEISESPVSVEKTIYNRWKYKNINGKIIPVVELDESVVPQKIISALCENKIKRIFFIGQGTAGVAAKACANILKYYLDIKDIYISAQKASEFSGFMMSDDDKDDSLNDILLIAISQSGTTTDTNRAVDMVKARGAHTIAIVNRRDSDITFKVDGVMYTSSGRDIEMSVASTKAFYSQIIAGAILGLSLAIHTGKRNYEFVDQEIKRLIAIPDQMRQILANEKQIADSAVKLATTRNHWAAVGSGPNKASADEIRIKLSELCYKTISTDFVEDKKHIDLSSEPLIIICTAGSKESVLADIIKDTAIFKAHKALPIVIADEGEDRFKPYAEDIIHVPVAEQHLSPILNTLVGHLWGYHAALTINNNSQMLFNFREEIYSFIDEYSSRGLDLYEILLEKSFREKIAQFYTEFIKRKREHTFPLMMGLETISDLTLLLKYLTGRLPVRDFEFDFGVKGTPSNMLETLLECLNKTINNLARPIDAIKHQAKTVTVGTSRISERLEGLLLEEVQKRFSLAQLSNKNVIVLRNLQAIIDEILGSILYKIGGLNLLGDITERTYIEVVEKIGSSQDLESRVESDKKLKGIKRIIVRQGNVYIGKGRRDNRSILVIPILSESSSRPNTIDHILLLNITFKSEIPLNAKILALGGKYEHIKNIVHELNIIWKDSYIDIVEVPELFGKSAEKIAEYIVANTDNNQKNL